MDRVWDYLTERSDKAPQEYVEFVYRREFGLTPQELDEVPAAIVLRDLQFMSLEYKAQQVRQM
jgi:Ser/Thr protein kinase RdoA (MazF antagonist)